MSSSSTTKQMNEVCANCGKAAVDDVKLKKCACNLVKYCTVDCQKNHRPQHKKACKKRMAEIRDDDLFTQPDGSHLGECPLCCLPLSIVQNASTLSSCCSQLICDGCEYANHIREMEQGLEHKCPFCREPAPKSTEEIVKNLMKRVKANDPNAINEMGKKYYHEGDYEKAFEYYTKAAVLGDIGAHHNLSVIYRTGEGVEKNEKKEVYHLEEAAIGGNPEARHNLGCYENKNGRTERAVKHFIIAAKLGHDGSLETVKKGFMDGLVSKEDYASALRGHQAAVDATKSEQRKEAEKNRHTKCWIDR
jgi:tetratricopeptide (TPR) repeat protein